MKTISNYYTNCYSYLNFLNALVLNLLKDFLERSKKPFNKFRASAYKTKQIYCLPIHLLFALMTTTACTQPLNVLHLSFHKGCLREIETIAQALQFDVTSLFIPDIAPQGFDGISSGNALYNISHERANNIWDKHKDYFNHFDAIITSDTAPLARIFLQNNYTKPLIIWVCNRFDYYDGASLDCDFPDEEFYQLFQQAKNKKHVYTIPYTAFESLYAEQKNVVFNHEMIQPSGIVTIKNDMSDIPTHIDKSQTFFIPPYLNDAALNLAQECANLGINIYRGRYNGPHDLAGFKGIIHIPYAWSNVAFFENIQNGLPYFVPSIDFMIKNLEAGNIWWQSPDLFKNNPSIAEWYNEQNSEIITYFDSWDDLKTKIESTDFNALRTKIKIYAENHRATTIEKWNKIFSQITNNY